MSTAAFVALAALLVSSPQDRTALDDLPVVLVDRDDVRVEHSCRLVFGSKPIVDANGDGVVHIDGRDIVVVCEGRLSGSAPGVEPDRYEGIGIVVRGTRVTLEGARVCGFRVGVFVERCFEARIVDADVSDNFRQRLRSTWEREDVADWLRPHDNDAGEWSERYGAGLRVIESRGVRIERLLARDVQNGILLERVDDSLVIGCDASFLSGWGLALWRSNRNRVLANRFDFCVRGYVHGRYNRGQDSAGVLLFEQSSHNVFEGNSLTHGGDGIFGFAGREALGEAPAPYVKKGDPPFDHLRRGCNGTIVRANDLSFAPAHGLELTFSFDTLVEGNLFEGNAICGVWFGYARDSVLQENRFVDNGGAGYGAERGAINAEHAQRLSISTNVFDGNALDVRLWTDADVSIAELPWTRRNGRGAKDNWIAGNHHRGVSVGDTAPWIELLDTGATATDVDVARLAADAPSRANVRELRAGDVSLTARAASIDADHLARVRAALLGTHGVEPLPDGVRPRGRAAIVVGEWGPYDHRGLFLQTLERRGAVHRYRVLGPKGAAVSASVGDERAVVRVIELDAIEEPWRAGALAIVEVRPAKAGEPTPFALAIEAGESTWNVAGDLLSTTWQVRFAPSITDPREEEAAWREAVAAAPAVELADLSLEFGGAGPVELLHARGLVHEALLARERGVGSNHFGALATTRLDLPAGRWRLVTTSDDGLRVKFDGEVVIDDWTWHAPKRLEAIVETEQARPVEIEVAYFELDGHAVLDVALERAP